MATTATAPVKHPHTKQIHENFKIIGCSFADGKLTKESKKELTEFLEHTKIHAQSINAVQLEKGTFFVSIGYTESKKEKQHSYKVSFKKLNEDADKASNAVFEGQLAKFAAKTANVICHGLFTYDGDLYAILLSTQAE